MSEHHRDDQSGALCRGLLKSGLGRFGIGGRKAAPQPHDYRSIIIFVVGGVCIADLRAMAEELQAARAGTHQLGGGGDALASVGPSFLLGGTALIGPQDVCRHVLGW